MSRYYLILILIVGLAFRLLFATTQPLSIDELFTYEVLRFTSFKEVLKHIIYNDLQLPSFYLIIYSIRKYISEDYLVFRMILAFLSTGTIYFSYLAGKALGGSRAGILSALFFSLSFSLVLFGVEFRPYSFLLLISTMMCWIYLEKKTKYFIKLLLLGLLASSFHLYGSLLIIPYLFLEYKTFKKILNQRPILSFSTIGALAILLMLISPIPLRNYDMEHMYRATQAEYFGIFEILNFLSLFFWGPWGFVFCLICLFQFLKNNTKRDLNWNIFRLLVIGIVPIVIILVKSLTSTPTLEPRYFVIFLPPLLIMISGYLTGFDNKQGQLIRVLAILLLLVDFFIYRNIFNTFRDDSEKYYQDSLTLARANNLPLISCGVCFWPYVSKKDNYICYKKQNAAEYRQSRAVVLTAGVDIDYCWDRFGHNQRPKNLKVFHAFLYGAQQ